MNHMPSGAIVARLIDEAMASMGLSSYNDLRWAFASGSSYTSKDDAQEFTSGTGAVAPYVATAAPGLRRFSVTGVGVGLSRALAGNLTGGWTSTTQPCFVKSRFARSGTLAAGSDQHVGFQNSPFDHGVGIGVFQSVSAVNFVVVKSASAAYTGVDTGIAINTNQNEFTLYRNVGGSWFWRINSGALTSMTTTGQPTLGNEGYGHIHVTNAAAPTALQLDLDYCFWAGRRAP